MKYKTKPCEIEAEQIRLNMVFNPITFPATLSSNPFEACVMRRPKWYKSPVPTEDVCLEHDEPRACQHGCNSALPHKCKEKESPDYEPIKEV